MRPIVTDRVAWSVCQTVTLVSPAKMAALIEMPFVLGTRVGPRNHVLHRGPDPPWEWAILRGKGAPHCKVQGHSVVICAKAVEPIEMPFGLWAQMGPMNHVLDAMNASSKSMVNSSQRHQTRWSTHHTILRCDQMTVLRVYWLPCTLPLYQTPEPVGIR